MEKVSLIPIILFIFLNQRKTMYLFKMNPQVFNTREIIIDSFYTQNQVTYPQKNGSYPQFGQRLYSFL